MPRWHWQSCRKSKGVCFIFGFRVGLVFFFFWLIFFFLASGTARCVVILYCSILCLLILWNPILFMVGGSLKGPQVFIQSQSQFYQQPLTQPLASGVLQTHTGDNSHVHQPPPLHAGFYLQNTQRKPRCAAEKSIAHWDTDNLDNQGTKAIHVGTEAARRA